MMRLLHWLGFCDRVLILCRRDSRGQYIFYWRCARCGRMSEDR